MMPFFIHENLLIKKTKNKGRGVFTKKPIAADTIIEVAPVVVMTKEHRALLDKTLLHDYIFEWGDEREQCCMALGWVPIYNHAYQSNCEYEMFFKQQTIAVKTVRAIKQGEELVINYNGDWDSEKKVWFDLTPALSNEVGEGGASTQQRLI